MTRITLDADPRFPAEYSAEREMRDGCAASAALRETFLLATLTGATPKTRRIYTRQPDMTRRLICSRGRCHTRIGRHEADSPTGKRMRYDRQRAQGCTLARPRAASTSLRRTLPASRQNYDPVRFALSAGRDCITMRGIPGIAFTCLELLRGPQ